MCFRLLNGSNARIYELLFSSNHSFYQIASDGGLLEKPVEMTKLLTAQQKELNS
jgi:blue copper oxidase